MFGLDPLSRPVAISEMLLLLAFAAFVGWLIARLISNSRVNALRTEIAEREQELADCRRAKATPVAPAQPLKTTAAPVVSVSQTQPVAPALEATTVAEPVISAPLPEPVLPEEPPLPQVALGSEAAVLSRIASRASELNFDRIGRATLAEADDLKEVVGIGPFLERKLHSLGIYTFRQVANFTKEDIDKVNEIIEFFPGRIERDNWVGQSKAFHEKKYNGKA
ncbi:hypothetical protein F5984_19595 [Rudanella paleaurantiibacter]|uniref:DUF4332 domain-containing protein n=1 Tax=Rudanella paleaurantiibacter TaxID=2614655 RepID=A0A7J5TVK9_9BACT|nr:hypothetical protein [Rudanella paleaurantiibacter]KAB7727963.1 hypothetical protein F5984_19595 [Rudanella paleaurantiibacter]